MDSSRGVMQDIRYDPFGTWRRGSGDNYTDKKFTGQQEEGGDPLGLYDYGARFYSTTLGRFISADPLAANNRALITSPALSSVQGLEMSAKVGSLAPSQGPSDPQSLDRYSYVLNNPLRYTDPSGMCLPDINCPSDGKMTAEEEQLWGLFNYLVNNQGWTATLIMQAYWIGNKLQEDPSCSECRGALVGIHAAAKARSMLGRDYEWGAKGKDLNGDKIIDFDCSGLVWWSYQQFGVDVGISTYDQYPNTGRIERAELRPGDLVFYSPGPRGPEHVAIYIGDGMVVEAPAPGGHVQERPIGNAWKYGRPQY